MNYIKRSAVENIMRYYLFAKVWIIDTTRKLFKELAVGSSGIIYKHLPNDLLQMNDEVHSTMMLKMIEYWGRRKSNNL